MTPLKLSMTAFGAYTEPTVIDFEKELRGAKIFLINGATGAGKTTILDAISYALYGETSGKIRDVKDMRSKGVADKVLTAVEFEFRLGDKKYKVRRELSIQSNKKEKFQKRALLFCEGHLIADKEMPLKNKVIELLGFNAEQFRQVVLLPQGDFKKFLASDSDKRQEVLNVLFDSEPYKKIEEALSERAKISAEAVKNLENEYNRLKEQLKNAESGSLPEVEEKLSSAEKILEEVKKVRKTAQADLTAGNVLAAKFADLKKIEEDLNPAQIEFDKAAEIFKAAEKEYKIREAEESERKKFEEDVRELEEIKSTLEYLIKKNGELEREKNKLAEAIKDFEHYDKRAKKYEARFNQLTADKARLECEKILGEILQLEANLAAAQEKVSLAEKNLNAAQIDLNRLQIVNNAARLVMTLKDGEPCPVCGALEHPAIIAEAIPTVAELKDAEDKVTRLTNEKSRLEKSAAKIEGALSTKKIQRSEHEGTPELAAAEKNFISLQKTNDELKDCLRRMETGKKFIDNNKTDLEKAGDKKNSATATVAKLEGTIAEAKKKIPEIYLTNHEQLTKDLNAAQKKFNDLKAAWENAEKKFDDSKDKKSAREATLKTLQKNFNERQVELKDKTPPDINSLEKNFSAANEKYEEVLNEKAKLENTLKTLKNVSGKLAEVEKNLVDAKKIADTWRRLSDVANATGKGESELKISFQRYFLSTMFAEVVTEANNRLKKMSNGRYLFQMKDAGKTKAKSAGLNLEIFDEYTGALRPVETLSGGESFLASLSLALGLASVVKNKVGGIKLDTIFIDEGFGSLDSETLDFAISTIIDQSGGRLVGIISHVEELKNQIPVRLEITKNKAGSTTKFIS